MSPDLATRIDRVPLAFFDVETTGLSPDYGDRICEIGIARYCHGEAEGSMQQLVHPQRPMGQGAYRVHGISDAMLADQPTFPEVASEVLALFQGAVVVGHCVAFDLGFLRAELAHMGAEPPQILALDTCQLARRNYRFPSNRLGRLASSLDVTVDGRAHRAMVDVLMTRGVFVRMVNDLYSKGLRTLGDVIRAQGGPIRVGRTEQEPQLADLPLPLRRALRGDGLLRITYRDASGRASQRLVRPLKVISQMGLPSLVAHCYLRNARRHFRLDRIEQMKLINDADAATVSPSRAIASVV